MYFKDAARAIVQLGEAPKENIKSVNYLIAGVTPMASAGELADIVQSNVAGAQINFEPDLELQEILERLLLPLDDHNARQEWGWQASYDQERIVVDFLQELKLNPQRYR